MEIEMFKKRFVSLPLEAQKVNWQRMQNEKTRLIDSQKSQDAKNAVNELFVWMSQRMQEIN